MCALGSVLGRKRESPYTSTAMSRGAPQEQQGAARVKWRNCDNPLRGWGASTSSNECGAPGGRHVRQARNSLACCALPAPAWLRLCAAAHPNVAVAVVRASQRDGETFAAHKPDTLKPAATNASPRTPPGCRCRRRCRCLDGAQHIAMITEPREQSVPGMPDGSSSPSQRTKREERASEANATPRSAC